MLRRVRHGGASGAARAFAAAGLLLAASLALFWPGIALYDSVAQFGEVLSGEYTDWHPPAMALLWAALHGLVGGGTAPMFVLQMGLYWLGLGLLAAALAREGRTRASAAVLAIGLWPPFLGWQAAVLKDAQMAAAALAAVGLVAWPRLRGRPVPLWTWAVVVVLLGYAILVRANGVFAIAPLAVMLAKRGRPLLRALGAVLLTLAVLAAAGPINHDLFGAEPTGVERTEALYDLSGIAVRAPDSRDTGLNPAQVRALVARRCVKPFFWDPLGAPERCDAVVEPLRDVEPGALYRTLALAALRHPLAYGEHRLAHLNSTERWLVPAGWPSAAPPAAAEPNALGLPNPGPAAVSFQRVAGRIIDWPLAWPIAWVAAALVALVIALRRRLDPARDLALALLISALALEASFAGLSIASDLRYHLWPMLAAALGIVLLGRPRAGEERLAVFGGAAVLLVILTGGAARLTLPPPPQTYAAMLR